MNAFKTIDADMLVNLNKAIWYTKIDTIDLFQIFQICYS